MKIVIDEDIPFIQSVFEPYAEVMYLPGKIITSHDVKSANALIVRTRTKCNEKLLSGSSVKFIASATIGYDHIDTTWCKNNGIVWSNAAGCNANSVGQYILAALLEIARRKNFQLKYKTIGIVGVGHVGSVVKKFAEILQMRVLLSDPPREQTEGSAQFVPLTYLVQNSDIITFHTPLINSGRFKTFQLLDATLLKLMKPGAVVINTSRGEVVDEFALKAAILEKRVGATVIDVWNNEPDIDMEFLELTDIATPHIAGYSTDGKAKATEMVVKAVSGFFNLPLDSWVVKKLPVIKESIIDVTTQVFSWQKLLEEIIPITYDINNDDDKFRANPLKFEILRKNYPIRREFPFYKINATDKHIPHYIRQCLNNLGFSLFKHN